MRTKRYDETVSVDVEIQKKRDTMRDWGGLPVNRGCFLTACRARSTATSHEIVVCQAYTRYNSPALMRTTYPSGMLQTARMVQPGLLQPGLRRKESRS